MRRGMWAVAIASLLGVSMPANADLVSFQGLQLDFAPGGGNNVLNVNIANGLITGGSGDLTSTITGSIFFDGTFDTTTGQITEISFNSATFGNVSDVGAILSLIIPGSSAALTLVNTAFNIGGLDPEGTLINGPFTPVSAGGTFNMAGNTLQINQGQLTYAVGPIPSLTGDINFGADPVDATIGDDDGIVGFFDLVQSGADTWDVTFSSPIAIVTLIDLLSPNDTTLTITLNLVATGELTVIPEPSSFALMGLVGAIGGGSVWYRRRQRAAKLAA